MWRLSPSTKLHWSQPKASIIIKRGVNLTDKQTTRAQLHNPHFLRKWSKILQCPCIKAMQYFNKKYIDVLPLRPHLAFRLSFTFLWKLRAWSQLEMGHIDCVKVSNYIKPYLMITHTWLNLLPGAGSGRNFLSSFAEWRVVPFLVSPVCFHLRNFLISPRLNTSPVPLQRAIAPETWKNIQHWSSVIFLHISIYIYRYIYTYSVLQGHPHLLKDLQPRSWTVPLLFKLKDDKTWTQTVQHLLETFPSWQFKSGD